MDGKDERATGERLLRHIDNRSTDLAPEMFANRVAAYCSPERAAAERVLFRSRPVFAGLSSRLSRPGDYMADDIAGMPVLLTRGGDGRLQAFANVCRHRGAPVAQGCGNARAFACPYHGWTYGLDGRLLGTTDRTGFAGLDPATHGLVRLPAGEAHGLIFVRPQAATAGEAEHIDVGDHLAGLTDGFDSWGWESFKLHSIDRLSLGFNWKLVVDTFLESYHIPHLHRRTIAPDFIGNLGTFLEAGPHGRQTMVRKSILEADGKSDVQHPYRPHILVLYQIFPNTLVIWVVDHLETWRAFPGPDPSQCEVELALYVPALDDDANAQAHWEKNRKLTLRTVQDEDFVLCKQMQAGFASGAVKQVVYGRNEPALIHFHKTLADVLGERAQVS
ncbi:MAG: aromatic ring-hydroxylating dioxygenase subunit alpha [Alphaproteobacteria bacterium]|nr:aromatic ring-hydroxylating dioxygenase subunit alpha [Alphaproteobacteria bacterium]